MTAPALTGSPCTVHDADGAVVAAAPSAWLEAPAIAVGRAITSLRADDWSPRYLVVDLRLRAQACGMLRLRVFGRAGGDPFMILLGLIPGLRTRLSLDLDILDGQSVFLRRHPGLLKGVAFGRRLRRDEIDRIELALDDAGETQELAMGVPHLSAVDAPWVDARAPQAAA
ncbi:MAG: hypothetical protein J0M02_16655, partial [Planctomycetes bacterium]|nr:hypothetical protein [Planctomycetota bacterium]